MTQKSLTLLQKLKEVVSETEDHKEILSGLIPQDDSDNRNRSRDNIITNSTIISVLIYQTGYNSPTIMHSLANISRKKIGTIKTYFGVIGKRESENDVVWITLQARHFRWKNVNIPKVKGYGKDAMSVFYNNPNHKENIFKLDTV